MKGKLWEKNDLNDKKKREERHNKGQKGQKVWKGACLYSSY
jgi:hypothetical protein